MRDRPSGEPGGRAEHERAPGRRPDEPEQHAQRRRLAGAVGPEEAVDLAAADPHLQVVDGDDALAVALAQAGRLDHVGRQHERHRRNAVRRRHNARGEELRRPPAGGRGSPPGTTRVARRRATVVGVRSLRRTSTADRRAHWPSRSCSSRSAVLKSGNVGGDRDLDPPGVLLALLTSLPLAVRRVAPLAVFGVITAATALLYAFDYGLGPPLGFAIAVYTLAETRDEASSRRRSAARRGRRGRAAGAAPAARRPAHGVPVRRRDLRRPRGSPASAPACAASGSRRWRSGRAAPSRRPSASAAWPPPRSARASPATCTTRRATRST